MPYCLSKRVDFFGSCFRVSLFLLGASSLGLWASDEKFTPFEQAEVLYIRTRLLQQDALNEARLGERLWAQQLEARILDAANIARGLVDSNDRGDLDDDDREEIRENRVIVDELADLENGGRVERVDGGLNEGALERVRSFIEALEEDTQRGWMETVQAALNRGGRLINVNAVLPDALEVREAFRSRVRALRSIFEVVNAYYQRWILVHEAPEPVHTHVFMGGTMEDYAAASFFVDSAGCL